MDHIAGRLGQRIAGLRIIDIRTDERPTVLDADLGRAALLRRSVRLRVYPTPSANLTVVELLPRRRRTLLPVRLFLRGAKPAVARLLRDAENAAPSSGQNSERVPAS